jgi:hypothetical protein
LHYRRDLLSVAQELRELHYRRDRYHRRDRQEVAQELQDSPVAQDSMVAVVVSKIHRVVLYPHRAAPWWAGGDAVMACQELRPVVIAFP